MLLQTLPGKRKLCLLDKLSFDALAGFPVQSRPTSKHRNLSFLRFESKTRHWTKTLFFVSTSHVWNVQNKRCGDGIVDLQTAPRILFHNFSEEEKENLLVVSTSLPIWSSGEKFWGATGWCSHLVFLNSFLSPFQRSYFCLKLSVHFFTDVFFLLYPSSLFVCYCYGCRLKKTFYCRNRCVFLVSSCFVVYWWVHYLSSFSFF